MLVVYVVCRCSIFNVHVYYEFAPGTNTNNNKKYISRTWSASLLTPCPRSRALLPLSQEWLWTMFGTFAQSLAAKCVCVYMYVCMYVCNVCMSAYMCLLRELSLKHCASACCKMYVVYMLAFVFVFVHVHCGECVRVCIRTCMCNDTYMHKEASSSVLEAWLSPQRTHKHAYIHTHILPSVPEAW
jgi:hypothetical protein